jgi:hypothetical protein
MGSGPVRVKGKGVSETMIQEDNFPDRTKFIVFALMAVIAVLMAWVSSPGK